MPQLTYCFDIDGTLCTNTEGDYEHAEPYPDVIAEVNRLFDDGHTIMLLSARGTTTGIDWRPATERQLAAWGVRYHVLHLGKPSADVYVDDKAINALTWRRDGFVSEAEALIMERKFSG
ncbi:MAG: hypothetical protein AUK49_03830 [Betaproteobacteria bacterium CG2_30_68_42]|nr:MAG: hypothetical protein AUK49_03830 [Betaproteobacteria bacterium CG2_30_68_42]